MERPSHFRYHKCHHVIIIIVMMIIIIITVMRGCLARSSSVSVYAECAPKGATMATREVRRRGEVPEYAAAPEPSSVAVPTPSRRGGEAQGHSKKRAPEHQKKSRFSQRALVRAQGDRHGTGG